MNYKATAKILNLPERFIKACWEMLAQLNSTHKMIDMVAYRALAKDVFNFYVEVRLHHLLCNS